MNIVQWQTAVTSGETPTESTPDALYPAGPWEPIGCGLSNGRINGGVEDMETVFCWRRPLSNRADTLPTTSPTEADIARRMELLQESCSDTIIKYGGPSDDEYGAIVDGKHYVVTIELREHKHFGPNSSPTAVWTEATPEVFTAKLRRVAVRQLLSERGAR